MHRSWVYNAWFFGSGVSGGIIASAIAAVLFTGSPDLVAAILWTLVLSISGTLVGFCVGDWVGVEHEDRVVRRRLGLPARTSSGQGG